MPECSRIRRIDFQVLSLLAVLVQKYSTMSEAIRMMIEQAGLLRDEDLGLFLPCFYRRMIQKH